MSDKISPIKERILQFIENQEITKKDFCDKTKISYANMRGKSLFSEIGGEQISEILSQYGEISPEWLLLGKGEMLRNTTTANNQANDDKVSRLITILQDNLAEKDKQIDQLLKIINRISSNTNNKQI